MGPLLKGLEGIFTHNSMDDICEPFIYIEDILKKGLRSINLVVSFLPESCFCKRQEVFVHFNSPGNKFA